MKREHEKWAVNVVIWGIFIAIVVIVVKYVVDVIIFTLR